MQYAQLFISILPRSAALPGNGMLITSAELNLEGQSCCLVPGYTVQLTISAIKNVLQLWSHVPCSIDSEDI